MTRLIKNLFLAIAILSSESCIADEGLMIELSNGQIISFAFANKPKVEIKSENMIFTTDSLMMEYSVSEVHKFYWGEIPISSIGTITKTNRQLAFSFGHSEINIKGLPYGDRVTISDLSGRLIARQTNLDSNGTLVLHLPYMTPQVLILRTKSGLSYKLLIK